MCSSTGVTLFPAVDDEEDDVRMIDGRQHLLPDFGIEPPPGRIRDAAGVGEQEGSASPVGRGELAIARHARLFGHDGHSPTYDAIEQGRLTDVGSSDDRHGRKLGEPGLRRSGAQFHLARTSVTWSPARISAPGTPPRTSSSETSSRKKPRSLTADRERIARS